MIITYGAAAYWYSKTRQIPAVNTFSKVNHRDISLENHYKRSKRRNAAKQESLDQKINTGPEPFCGVNHL